MKTIIKFKQARRLHALGGQLDCWCPRCWKSIHLLTHQTGAHQTRAGISGSLCQFYSKCCYVSTIILFRMWLGMRRWDSLENTCVNGIDSRSKPALAILFILSVVLGSSPGLTYARQMLGAELHTSPGFSYHAEYRQRQHEGLRLPPHTGAASTATWTWDRSAFPWKLSSYIKVWMIS